MIYDYSFRNRLILCKEETFIISLKFKTGNEKPKTVPQKHKTQDTPKLSCLQYSTVVEHTCLAYTALHVYSPAHTCMHAHVRANTQECNIHPSLPASPKKPTSLDSSRNPKLSGQKYFPFHI